MNTSEQGPGMERGSDWMKRELNRLLSSLDFEEGAVLVQLPQVPADLLEKQAARNRGYFSYPPQGLLYLSAAFRSIGVRTSIIDLNYAVLKEAQREQSDIERAWEKALDDALSPFFKPLVCVSFMFELTFPYFKEVCHFIRSRRPGSCIAAGGGNATADPDSILVGGLADLVFRHEAEVSIPRFYDYLRGNTKDIPPNLSFLDSQGKPVHTHTVTGGDVNLDIRGEYTLIDIRNYHEVGSLSNFSRMNGIEVPFATVISRRGCRGHCRFCSVRGFCGKGVRVRDVEGVLAEMETLYHQYGIRHFDWLDDDLLYAPQKAKQLFEGMASRLPDITWGVNNGVIAAAVTRDLMRSMEKSGCLGLKVGLESGNEAVLKKIRKPTSIQGFFTFAKIAQEFPKIFTVVNFILGLPEDTFGQMLDSLKVALRAAMDWNSFFLYQPIKNTAFYIAYGGLGTSEGQTSDGKKIQLLNLNPVRGGSFNEGSVRTDLASGYDIFSLDSAVAPSRDQLREIWFTFNILANFLRMPALFTESEVRLRNGVRWTEVLAKAYPEDASLSCLLYYLKRRLSEDAAGSLEELRRQAWRKIEASRYWQFRDAQFGISDFLDGVVPYVDQKYVAVEELP